MHTRRHHRKIHDGKPSSYSSKEALGINKYNGIFLINDRAINDAVISAANSTNGSTLDGWLYPQEHGEIVDAQVLEKNGKKSLIVGTNRYDPSGLGGFIQEQARLAQEPTEKKPELYRQISNLYFYPLETRKWQGGYESIENPKPPEKMEISRQSLFLEFYGIRSFIVHESNLLLILVRARVKSARSNLNWYILFDLKKRNIVKLIPAKPSLKDPTLLQLRNNLALVREGDSISTLSWSLSDEDIFAVERKLYYENAFGEKNVVGMELPKDCGDWLRR